MGGLKSRGISEPSFQKVVSEWALHRSEDIDEVPFELLSTALLLISAHECLRPFRVQKNNQRSYLALCASDPALVRRVLPELRDFSVRFS